MKRRLLVMLELCRYSRLQELVISQVVSLRKEESQEILLYVSQEAARRFMKDQSHLSSISRMRLRKSRPELNVVWYSKSSMISSQRI